MLPRSKWMQYGEEGLHPRGINVAGQHYTAPDLYIKLLNGFSYYATHYIVDSKQIIQCMPKNWKVRTNKKDTWGNENCISVTICDGYTEEDFSKANEKAVLLIKDLVEEYNLNYDDIHFFNDFDTDSMNPRLILEKYGSRLNWLQKEFNNGNSNIA